MPLISRYNTQIKGAMTFIGNTVGLSKLAGGLKAGTLGSIGTFISLDTNLQVDTFPPGTTLEINQNGSEAQLVLPVDSSVVRAELIWGGSYYYRYQQGGNDTVVDLGDQINNPVYLTTPSTGEKVQINPDPVTGQTQSFSLNDGGGTRTIRWYMRSADVTAWVSSAGTYSVEKIVGAIVADDRLGVATNHAGWTLAVVYQNLAMEERTLYLWVGAQMINGSNVSNADIPISGFQTKPSGPISARLLLSSQEGDANIVGDRMYFGQNAGSLTNLSGPNNPINNFFASQINDDTGNLNTTGTFGTLNANAATGVQIVGGRQGWDITNIDVSPEMKNNQNSALIRLTTNGDAYMMNGVGLQLDVLKLETKVIKTVDLQYADIGETLTYTISVTNKGNVPITQLILTDTIPSGTTLVPDSVTIDTVITPGANPSSGINLGTLAEGDTVSVTFQVKVTGLPEINPIENIAGIIYHYSPVATSTDQSNPAKTYINHARMTPVKSVNKSYAQLGEVLIYSTILSNTGTTSAINVFFEDSLPSGVTFVSGSVKIDGVEEATLDPNLGFSVGDIAAGSSRIIHFDGLVASSFPMINPILNTSQVSYDYRVDPLESVINVPSISSNQVTTQINEAIVDTVKEVDKAVASFGEVVAYTTTLTNRGNVTATQIQFLDAIPEGMKFVAGSVKVDGIEQPLLDPSVGFSLSNLVKGASHSISFQVTVNSSLPVVNPIPNISGGVYSYLVDPLGAPVSQVTTISNRVLTQVNDSVLVAIKSADKEIVDVGEVLNYTVIVTNQGNISQVGASFQDTLPIGVDFVNGSVVIDGMMKPSYNPQIGFALPPIEVGESVSISFSVTVEAKLPIPVSIQNRAIISTTTKPEIVSNTVVTQIKHAKIQALKQVDQSSIDLSGVLRYTVTLTNVGNTTAEGVVVTDSMPEDTTFVPGSVRIEGIAETAADPTSGILIGSVLAGEVVVVDFRVTVKGTLPVKSPIQNTAELDYQYVVDPGNPPITPTQLITNQVSTVVNTARISTVKAVDLAIVDLGGSVVYTMTLTNLGTTTAQNVILYDIVPVGTTFISGSVSVGGIVQPLANPATGVLVGTLLAGASEGVSFSVRVGQTMPETNPLKNRSTTSYEYFVDPSGSKVNGPASTSNEVSTLVANATLDLYKTVNTLAATLGDTLKYTLVVTNKGNRDAERVLLTDSVPPGTSFVPGSVKIEGLSMPGDDPGAGISLGTIGAGVSVSVTFDSIIGGVLPIPNPVQNTAIAQYQYLSDPLLPPVSAKQISNTVQTLVIEKGDLASLDVVKSVDKKYSQLGETLLYGIRITNTGNTDALDLRVTDPLVTGITFVKGSVEVGEEARPFDEVEEGIAIRLLAPEESILVTFKVTVDKSLPPINPIPNEGLVAYSFRTDPDLDPISGSVAKSNKVTTLINEVNIGTLKGVDLHFADLEDILTYTVGVANLGTVEAVNVRVIDSMPRGTRFIPGSVSIDSRPWPLADPEMGINVAKIEVNQIILVTYQVQVLGAIPSPNPISNTAQIAYDYFLDPLEPVIPAHPIITDPVNTQINHGTVMLTKLASVHYADWNEEITYTITATNSGNVQVTDVVVTDNIPEGTTFVVGSVIVSGNNEPLMVPDIGMTIPYLGVGASEWVSFKVRVDEAFPIVNPIPNKANSTYVYKVDPLGTGVTGSAIPSNREHVQVNHGHLEVLKEEDRAYVDVGEEITYTLTLTQRGNVELTQIRLVDQVGEGGEFVLGSVVVGGVSDVLAHPSTGIPLPDLKIGESIVVTFRIRVISIPSINLMPNVADISYVYRVDPLKLATSVAEKVESNRIFARVNHAELLMNKMVNKAFAGTHEVLVYTVLVSNVGSTLAEQVMFSDQLPAGVSFVEGSVAVGGVVRPLDNPEVGINLGNIGEGSILPVSFSVQIGEDLPMPNPLLNLARATYGYRIDPEDTHLVTPPEARSNEVSTLVQQAKLVATKVVSTNFADVEQVINYTITLTNEGNVTTRRGILVDSLTPGTSFVPETVSIDGVVEYGADPAEGISLPDIPGGASLEVTFKVRIGESLPEPNPVFNTALANYQYQIGANSTPVVGDPALTNETAVQINTGQVLVEKQTDQEYKDLGEIIVYTLTLTHVGNVEAKHLILTDRLAAQTVFIPESVTIGGIAAPMANPNSGIALDPMMPGEVRIITFKAEVIDRPVTNPIKNQAVLAYAYQVTPNQPVSPHQSDSNITKVYIRYAKLETIKSVNTTATTEGEVLTYKLELNNTGNVKAQNILVKEQLPEGIYFIPGTVVIDGAVVTDADPNRGISLSDMPLLMTRSLTFKVRVGEGASNPILNTLYTTYAYEVDPSHPLKVVVTPSNEVSVVNIRVQISLIKTADKDQAAVGDEITYTFTATNTGEIELEDVVIKDLLEEQLDFIAGSVVVEGFPRPLESILTGVSIGRLNQGATKIIGFKAKIIKKITNKVNNQGLANLFYKFSEEGQVRIKEQKSNFVNILVEAPNLMITKEADTKIAQLGQIITYHVTLVNSGETPLLNIIFKDELPRATQFLENSLTSNGVIINGADLEKGVNIGGLDRGRAVELMYQVRVISGSCEGIIENLAYAEYEYRLEDHTMGKQVTEKVGARVIAQMTSFKQTTISKLFEIPKPKPNLEEVDDVSAEVILEDTYVIRTVEKTSHEGQRLSGYKLMIHGKLEFTVEYTASSLSQQLHLAHFSVLFTNFIILPVDYREGQSVEVTAVVEDTEGMRMNERALEANVMLLLIAKVLD